MKKIILIFIAMFNTIVIFAQTAPTYFYNSETSKTEFMLSQNYPDPFIEYTLIEFTLTSDKFVKIYVKDSYGEIIETLVEGEVDPGSHNVYFKPASKLENGIYFYCMDIFSGNNLKVIYSDKKEMQYDKRNIVLFKK